LTGHSPIDMVSREVTRRQPVGHVPRYPLHSDLRLRPAAFVTLIGRVPCLESIGSRAGENPFGPGSPRPNTALNRLYYIGLEHFA